MINNVPDLDVKQKLQQIIECADKDSFNAILKEFPERYSAGVVKQNVNFEELNSFIADICLHYCISQCS